MNLQCGISHDEEQRVVLGHGGGGRLSFEFIHQVIAQELKDVITMHDQDAGFFEVKNPHSSSSFVGYGKEDLVMTTDSFVIDPLFFPGGDIGKLSVVGSVNDIAMMGADPIALSLAFIIEEGFLISEFKKILQSIASQLKPLNLTVTCGDTKVVPRGKVDRLFINTSAVGVRYGDKAWAPQHIEGGDRILISRDIGRHGTAVMGARHNLGLSSSIQSDCHELLSLTKALIKNGVTVHCARDLTRGGLLSAAVELAQSSHKIFEIEEDKIPTTVDVKSFCEVLGLDVLSMANEGAAIYFVPEKDCEKALSILRQYPQSLEATLIGKVRSQEEVNGYCLLRLITGVFRRCVLPPGELLPRIC